jgi:hypothetical protein
MVQNFTVASFFGAQETSIDKKSNSSKDQSIIKTALTRPTRLNPKII